MGTRDHDSPDKHLRTPLDLVAVGVCAGLCFLLPIGPARGAEPKALDMPTVHSAARSSMKSLRRHEPAASPSACGAICGMPDRRPSPPEDSQIQMGSTSAFDLINERRELRVRWRGSNDGFREQSLKLRVSRNRSALTWEGRF